MGAVYKARDTRLDRTVALKVIRPQWTDDLESQRRLVREARAAAAVNHPHIVTVYEIDTDGGLTYVAMEYVEGGTLARLLDSGPLPVERALRIAAQVAGALVAAHAAGIVHRDLKPSNIMLSAGDCAKVVDFGLAKQVALGASSGETRDALTATGVLLGSVPYMSPEQASGVPVDPRSDLFSLGLVLYEMLSGRRAFGGTTDLETLAAILRDQPPPIPNVPSEASRLVERCLRKNAAERFQSAAELGSAIDACLAKGVSRDRASVAVLPFVNMSGSPEDDPLCEGLAEEIINALTKIPALRVIARTSSFAVARLGLGAREAGEKLGVGHLLEGSVRRSGARVRVNAQLVSPADGSQLWSERYDRELTDLLVLEDDVASAIAGRLQAGLGSVRTVTPRPAVDRESYVAFLEGRHHFARGTPEALATAKVCYERAIERDPGFAQAYDSLAELWWFLGLFGNVPPRDAFAASTWHALHALEIDDTLAETHALLGMLRKELDYNWPEVDREVGLARELSPESPLVRTRYAVSALLPRGRVEEGVRELESVVQVDPLSVHARWWLSVMALLARRQDRVEEEALHMISLAPEHFLGHWALGMQRDLCGAHESAVAALERANELAAGAAFTLGFFAYTLGRAGHADRARALLGRASEAARTAYVHPTAFAFGYLGLGERDRAFEWLDRAIEERDPLIMPIKTYHFLDPIRDDELYRLLLHKMNLD